MTVAPENKIYRFLDTNGDGTGTKDAIGNYSNAGSGVEHFYFQAKGYADIHRMIVHYEDGVGMRAERYGSLASALTNGILIKVLDSDLSELLDITDYIPIKSNSDWARIAYDVQLLAWGAGNESIGARLTFTRAGGPIRLEPGQRLVVILNDDFTGLVDQYFMIQGEYKP